MQVKASLQYSINDLALAATWLIKQAGEKKLWCFYGDMGAGKTTLIKEVCHQMGIGQNVSSPTFSLVNEYTLPQGDLVYHFDFYRIKSIDEAYDIGYEMYFESGAICLIEWPEKIEEILLGETTLPIQIMVLEAARLIQILA
jgi:tRNA threonylcarbamoyladenosine biosynthesis protein TsaE